MLCAVLLRSKIGLKPEIKMTLKLLKLKKKHNAMLYPENEYYMGMLKKVKDYVAYGKITKEVMVKLFEKRAYIHNKKLTTALKNLGYNSINEFVDDIEKGKISINGFISKGLMVPFRLNSPRKGLKNSRKAYSQGGSLGNWGEDIDSLLVRMI